MPVIGEFADLAMRSVAGYKISALWNPKSGFDGLFYIRVLDWNGPGERFAQAVDVGRSGQPRRGTLRLHGQHFDYEFRNIDLVTARIGATRGNRYRALEFQYEAGVTRQGQTPIELHNMQTDALADGALRDFQYCLSDGSENLLGYSAWLSPGDPSAVRFSALRNRNNCFMAKMIQANDQLNHQGRMDDLKVTFSQGDYAITPANLWDWHIDESYGLFHEEERIPLEEIVAATSAGGASLRRTVRSRLQEYSSKQLLQLDARGREEVSQFFYPTVETSTFIFLPGHYQDLRIT